jgi:hypothetical protein
MYTLVARQVRWYVSRFLADATASEANFPGLPKAELPVG